MKSLAFSTETSKAHPAEWLSEGWAGGLSSDARGESWPFESIIKYFWLLSEWFKEK